MLVPSPKWLDSGNNAWQLAAATFVGLQSIPGLAVLYAGYVKQKWAINSAFMCFYAFASVLVVWVLFDYNMAFGEQWFPFLGKPALATSAIVHHRPGDDTGSGLRHAGNDLPDGYPDVLPVRVRCDHRDHSRGLGARAHELRGVGGFLPGVDDAGLHGWRVQSVGRRLALPVGRSGLFGRLRHPSRRRHVRVRRRSRGRAAPAGGSRAIPAQQPAWSP